MARKIFIVDTNVVVSALIGSDPDSPPVWILDAMLEGAFPYVMSTALFNEYSSVLRRPAVVRQHGLTEPEVALLLSALTANATWHDPVISNMAININNAGIATSVHFTMKTTIEISGI